MIAALLLALALGAAPVDAAPVESEPATAPAKPAYGPEPPETKVAKAEVAGPDEPDRCSDQERATADNRTIVVCAQKPNGYRLNPDILDAKKAKRAQRKPPPRDPNAMPDTGICERSGGCRGMEAVNWIGVALTAAEMARRAVNGENVGKMFVTNPNPSEYELYQMAKQDREAREAEEAAARAKARQKARAAALPKVAAPAEKLPEAPPAE